MINHIRIGEDFFISFGPAVSSLGFKGLPKDVHLSLSYAPGKPINFHVTRNIGDGTNKPHISIFKMDKKMAEKALQALSSQVIMHLLQPLDISYHVWSHRKGRMNGVKFLSFNNFEERKQYQAFRNGLLTVFRKSSTVKRNRKLKILPSIEANLAEWAQDPQKRYELAENFEQMPRKFTRHTDMGLLICSVYKGPVIRINNQFYTFRKDGGPIYLAQALLGPELANHLIFKTKLAIQRIKNAANYQETEKFNQPVILFFGEDGAGTGK